jgi:uncharacterized membrane protein (UPF0127 family)
LTGASIQNMSRRDTMGCPDKPGNDNGQKHHRAGHLMLFSRTLRAASLAASLALTFVAAAPARAAEEQALEIVTRNGVFPFTVEIAVTDEERQKGLMFRRSLPEGRGMLFDFKQDVNATMWMKNTYISLDMIFIRANGVIQSIAEKTEPESTRLIPAGAPVRAVLEVIAGTARKLGIKPGDRVAHPLFRRN